MDIKKHYVEEFQQKKSGFYHTSNHKTCQIKFRLNRTLLAMSFEAGAVGGLSAPVFVSVVRRSLATFCIRTELSPSAVIPAWASPINVPKRLQDR